MFSPFNDESSGVSSSQALILYFILKVIYCMQDNEELILALLHRAETEEHSKFQFIKCRQEYLNARKVKYAYEHLTSSIAISAEKLFKKYCNAVVSRNADVTILLAYCKTRELQQYYEEELSVVADMISEYEYYLRAGNWSDFIFNKRRPFSKFIDYRGTE